MKVSNIGALRDLNLLYGRCKRIKVKASSVANEVRTKLVDSLKGPIAYLEKTEFKSQASLASFYHRVRQICDQALSSLPKSDDRALFERASELFEQFSDLSSEEQKEKVLLLKRLLHHQENRDVESKETKLYFSADHPVPDEKKWLASYDVLLKSIQYVKGVGPAIAEKLRRNHLMNVMDLLSFFPVRYEDRRRVVKIADLQEKVACVVVGTVTFAGIAYYKGLRKRVYEVVVNDGSGELKLKWFNYAYTALQEKTKVGRKLIVFGSPRKYRKTFEIHHPDIEIHQGQMDSMSFGRIVPIYKETKGVHQKKIRSIIQDAMGVYAHHYVCPLPPSLCKKYDLCVPWKAIGFLQQPQKDFPLHDMERFKRVFSFQELFFYCLSLALRKQLAHKSEGISFSLPSKRYEKLMSQLPFELTGAQEKVLTSIAQDMSSEHAMNRLLQGDVGSGKTIVALLAALIAVDSGYQVAILAPTEVLAAQHLQSFRKYLKGLEVECDLLVGKLSKDEKAQVLGRISTNKTNIVVGTHAVLQSPVGFSNLGLVVVDEQHRFGVRQRGVLKEKDKGTVPDVLVMSATPIPRTLAMTLYGDLDVSLLNEVPKHKKPIETHIVLDKNRGQVYLELEKAVKEGRQAFVIYPLVEFSEHLEAKDATSMAQVYQDQIFPHLNVGLLHGRLKSEEKEAVLAKFKNKEIDILVSTTVIEVGINFPNATLMVIEHPERFGLSQLHQLRGRVGRGAHASKCILLFPPKLSKMAQDRLKIFERIHDGFELAEEDLRLRGPGDFFGLAQSGFPRFAAAEFPQDLPLLEKARREAFEIVQRDPQFQEAENKQLPKILEKIWKHKLDLIQIA